MILKFAGSKERREIQDRLRKTGTFNWNMNAELNKGELMTSRRPNPKFNKKAADFKPCPYCVGSYGALRHHVAYNCKNKPIAKNEAAKGERIITALSTSVERRVHHKASKKLETLFTTFRQNEIVHLIRFDWLIILFGNKICQKNAKSYQKGMKRYRLRMAGRILQTLKTIEPDVTDFASIYKSKYYDSLVEAIRIVSRYDDERNEFGAPGCASTAVTLIKQMGKLLVAAYVRLEEPVNIERTKNFMLLVDTEISEISYTVTETQNRMRRDKTVILPLTEDVKVFSEYVESERRSSFIELSSKYSFATWKKLSESTLISILLFNRKRVGESQNILVEYFKKRESINEKMCGLLYSSLKDSSKRVAQQYTRMKIRAKRDSTVHVLLKPDVVECIELLLTHRLNVGISTDNEYLFALPSLIDKDKQLNACQTLHKFAIACGANNSSNINGTNLRKHLATVCVSMDLNDSVVADVAKFMGHAEKVHREYYRQNNIDREVVQMSRILEAALGNNIDDGDESETDDSGATSGTISKGIVASSNAQLVNITNSVGNLQLNSKKTARKRNVHHASSSYLNDEAPTDGKSKLF